MVSIRFEFELLLIVTWISYLRFDWFFLQIEDLHLNFLFKSFYLVLLCILCLSAYVCYCLFTIRVSGVQSLLLWISRVFRSSARQVHTLIIFFIPSFYALVSTLKHCMSRFDNMWVLGSSWWGRNLLSYIQTLGCYYVILILLCYACRRGLVWENSWKMCERYCN